MQPDIINFCSSCGSDQIVVQYPKNDSCKRPVCQSCHRVFYHNPSVITGCLVQRQNEFLLIKRAIEPKRGAWAIPSGFMENGETLEQAALREVLEETGAKVQLLGPYSIFSIPQINQVYILLRAEFIEFVQAHDEETEELAFFCKEAIPWDKMSYPAMAQILKRCIDEGQKGNFGLYLGDAQQGQVLPFDRHLFL